MQKRAVMFMVLVAVILLMVALLAVTWTGGAYERLANSGKPLVQAVSDYRAVHGLFPIEWSDLVPTFLSAPPSRDWRLNPGYVSCYPTWPSVAISYHFNGGWSVVGEGINRQLNIPDPTPPRTTLVGEALFTTKQAEYERRINRHPTKRVWYADKIKFLALENRPEALREECERASMIFHDWWFPQMVLAENGTPGPATSARFAKWADEYPSHINYWHLARHYRNRADVDRALAALNKASTCQFEAYPETSEWVGAALAFEAARFSYEHKNYDLTLRLCQQWQSLGKDYGEKSWLAFQAAAELATGRFDTAVKYAQEAIKANGQQSMWARDLPSLLQAAMRHETNFIYQAGTTGNDWRLFTEPRP